MVALTLPCGTAPCRVHAWIGFAIVGGWFVFFVWGGLQFLFFRGRDPSRWFWTLLGGLQTLLILQVVAGVLLLVLGRPVPGVLHLAYGAVFPVGVVALAHVLGRRLDDPSEAWKVFTVASFFVFGLTLRALTTGLGLP